MLSRCYNRRKSWQIRRRLRPRDLPRHHRRSPNLRTSKTTAALKERHRTRCHSTRPSRQQSRRAPDLTTRADILFIVELSVRYHRRRASFLDLTSALMSLVTVIGGAGAFLTLIGGDNTAVAKVATLLLTLVGTIQLVFRIDTAAAAHKQWLKQWLRMLHEVRATESPDGATISRWIEQRYSIEADCVTEMRALQVDCFNRTASALRLDHQATPLRWWHRGLIQVWPFENSFPNG